MHQIESSFLSQEIRLIQQENRLLQQERRLMQLEGFLKKKERLLSQQEYLLAQQESNLSLWLLAEDPSRKTSLKARLEEIRTEILRLDQFRNAFSVESLGLLELG